MAQDDVIGNDMLNLAKRMNADGEIVRDQETRARITGETLSRETERPFADNTVHNLLITKYPFRDETGEVAGVVSVSVDLTDQKKAENAIRESEAKLQAITQNAPMLLNLKDMEGRYQFVNDVYAQWVGKPVDEIIGKTVTEVFRTEPWTPSWNRKPRCWRPENPPSSRHRRCRRRATASG
ncbi:PAS domain-containing protein [Thalassospiraceae bacterium LMO-SO8]|nr:PAS domain-containing protein [Thalassospiraceae bacterium LMO-SO8]